MLGPRERMPQHHYTISTSTYDEAHPLLQASHHHRTIVGRHYKRVAQGSPHSGCLQIKKKTDSQNSTEYYAIDHLTSAKLRCHTVVSTPQRTTLSQLRSGHCHLLNSYKHRIGWEDDPSARTVDMTTRT